MINQFDLTEEQRQMALQFAADALSSSAGEWDEKHIFSPLAGWQRDGRERLANSNGGSRQ